MSDSIVFRPIGVVRSEHLVPQETPIQPVYAGDCHGRVEILPEFADGLHDASLALLPYEAGRPSAEAACRVGDARVLAQGEG